MGIEELVGGDRRPHQTPFNAVEAARVHALVGGEVSLAVSSFDRGKQVFATVPFIATGTASPANGDSAVLHCDSAGHPLYAVVWT
jgi:hypothetical protein